MGSIRSIHDIHDGDMILESGGSIIADEIQWFENSDWNHALRCFWVRGRLYAYEAKGRGPTATPFEVHLADYQRGKKRAIVVRPRYGYLREDVDKMFHFVNPLCGKARYGYWNLIVLQGIKYGWKKLFGKELWLGNNARYQNDRFYICGQLVMRMEDIALGNQPDWESAAPVDIFNMPHCIHLPIKINQ